MELFAYPCPCCARDDVHIHTHDSTQAHGSRTIFHCRQCDVYFSETLLSDSPAYGTSAQFEELVTPIKWGRSVWLFA